MDSTTLILLIFISAVVIVGIGGFIWAVNKED
jgi:nitrogen fixation-related uncharacterized protein